MFGDNEEKVALCKQAGIDGPVRVDMEQFTLDQAKPEGDRIWSAWTGAVVDAAPETVAAPKIELPSMLVMKDPTSGKFKIVDTTGTPVTGIDGIDAAGYSTQKKATDAIKALTDA